MEREPLRSSQVAARVYVAAVSATFDHVDRAPNLNADVNLLWDVFLFDSARRLLVRLSDDELGGWMEPSAGPAIDGSGQVIAFSSRHPIAASDRGDDFDLFVRAVIVPPVITRKSP